MTSPSKLKHAYTVSEEEEDEDVMISTPSKTTAEPSFKRAQTEPPPSMATRRDDTSSLSASNMPREPRRLVSNGLSQHDNLSKLPPQLLHNLRESFSVLDSNSNGTIDAASVAETLHSLGLRESNLSQFFPPGESQQLSLPQYLSQLANLLVGLSPQQELLNAFSAFDDDDSGQIDVAELRTALLNTVPDPGERPMTQKDIDRAMEGFTGRRILGKNVIGIAGVRGLNTPAPKKGGDVFRYQEFVGNLTGGPATDSAESQRVAAR
jgi:Ca2+-binding EF-hand superfamily protein